MTYEACVKIENVANGIFKYIGKRSSPISKISSAAYDEYIKVATGLDEQMEYYSLYSKDTEYYILAIVDAPRTKSPKNVYDFVDSEYTTVYNIPSYIQSKQAECTIHVIRMYKSAFDMSNIHASMYQIMKKLCPEGLKMNNREILFRLLTFHVYALWSYARLGYNETFLDDIYDCIKKSKDINVLGNDDVRDTIIKCIDLIMDRAAKSNDMHPIARICGDHCAMSKVLTSDCNTLEDKHKKLKQLDDILVPYMDLCATM